ncbi:MAG: UvrD-helicase domain-containing protein, partial [Bacteroidota bacterium]
MEHVALLKHLNKEQKEAVISKNKRLLVLAGAGSGKTQTLLNKILYLIEIEKVSPAEILAITFTKNAANEMIDRLILSADHSGTYQNILNNKKLSSKEKNFQRLSYRRNFRWIQKITIRTFHSFCYQLLRNYGVNEFDNKFKIIADKKIAEEEELSKYVAPETSFEIFHRVLIEQCEDRSYMLKLKRYVLDYIIEKIHIQQNHFAASYEGKFYRTLDGTQVRSKSEQFIADWLYRHSIRYEYEPDLNVSDFHFRPDFFIPDANIYLEHNSNKSYNPENKIKQFKKGQLLCVTTNESITKDSALFNHTLDKLIKNRLPGNYQPSTALSYREEFNRYHEDIGSFITQVMRITDMIKVENHSPDKILKKALTDQHERIRLFYELAIPLVKRYIDYCTNKSFLDFNDLINTSIEL